MPRLSGGGSDEEAEGGAALASWLVAPGDAIEKGDVIAELETDKSTIELEAPASGTLLEIVVPAGSEGLTPGTLLATLEQGEGAGASAPKAPALKEAPDERDRPAAGDVTSGEPTQAAPPAPPSARSEPVSTPLARRAAAREGVDLEEVAGTGPRGRIVEADVLRGAAAGEVSAADSASESAELVAARTAAQPATGPSASSDSSDANNEVSEQRPHTRERLTAMRRTIARRLTESKQQVPHFYLRVRCQMDALMAARARINQELKAAGRETKISINDFIVKAAALAMRDVPAANVRFAGDAIDVFDCVDAAVAVATDGGLVTPVVRDADRLGLAALADEIRALAEKARTGRLQPAEYQGGTLTISNLGMYGIETVYPILNPPQACILGVGAAEPQPIVREGEIVIGQMAVLTLAADHRAIDGAVGAEWLARVRRRIEDPAGMIL